ncbi:unnamed protein product [Periconia digitata]|uniref:ATP-dependent DNA helicase PIF1 n=1 Tax=Periconia digitata TaxID=1303443 RepID=A0A9W4UE87_9PLEO|nr:unnamed protein product [Periconia digitata]
MIVALVRIRAPVRIRAGSALPSTLPWSPHRGASPYIFGPTNGSNTPSPSRSTRIPTLRPRAYSASTHLHPVAASTIMFKQAVKKHSTATPAPMSPPASRQQSLTNAFKRPQNTPTPLVNNTSTRPLSTLSGNAPRVNTEAPARQMSGHKHGIKRTSSGLAKALGSQESSFDYPSVNTSDWESPAVLSAQNNTQPQISDLFNESDFDSDIDLDVEDPATKATVKTPQPAVSNSSQPIPWSSSPVEHLQPAQRVEQFIPEKTKRRTLPWLQNQSQQNQTTEKPEEEEVDPETTRPRKRRSAEPTNAASSTPAPKKEKPKYEWLATQSAIKQQQKNLRESNKMGVKVNKATPETKEAAVAKKKTNHVHKIFLSEEQQRVLNLVTDHKKSVFFTGSAGTGKSVLLREIIVGLRKKYIREPDRVAVTASTGLAACNIGGVTLHSFAGIGLGKEPAEDLIKKIRRNIKAKQRWMRTKVLIVDEVSMVDGELFDKLEQIARTIRNNGRPFGGIQLIITGDFFQLPPVPEQGRVAKFAFDAGTWTTSIEHTIGLHHVFRQKDPVFANMLNEMREGRLTPDSISKWRTLSRQLEDTDDSIEATELFPTRQEVDRANQLRMNQLSGQVYTFHSRDGGSITNKEQRDRLLQNCMVPETIFLKKGAQVMLVKNMDDTLVNGSLGKVFSFMTESQFNNYKENEDAFLEGRGGINASAAPTAASIKEQVLGFSTQQIYPVVRFAIADGTTRDIFLKRESWKIELPNGEVQASREQIPLILAWALSIHKAQGQTLERVRVDLGKVFEKGQAYVALSRATSMAGLQVMRFEPRKIMAHDKVRQFYAGLSRAEQIPGEVKEKTVLGKMMER